jgi:hypothetical protein
MIRRVTVLALCAGGLAAPARAQAPAGGEFRVNAYTTSFQSLPAAAVAPDGRFVVVWNSMQPGSLYDVLAQRYDAAGAPLGSEFRVNTYTTGVQALPAVAADPRGGFVVAWQSAGQTATGFDVFARRFDAAGTAAAPEFQVNTVVANQQYAPHLAVAPNGSFVVVWDNYSLGGPSPRWMVAGRRFSASGAALGAEFTANTHSDAGTVQARPFVSVNRTGGFLVTWDSGIFPGGLPQDGSEDGVFGQRFDAAGARIGGEFRVNTYTTGAQRRSASAFAADGSFLVAWDSPQDAGASAAIMAQRFSAAGTPIGAEFRVNSYTTGGQVDVAAAADAVGNVVLTWESVGPDGDGLSVAGQRLSALGAFRGGEFAVNTYTTGGQGNSAVAVDPAGNFVVAWEGPQPASSVDVFARRFGGLFPRLLEVDGGGNQVLDPGESAAVRPSWQNLTGAAQAFGSTLASLTGPAGGTYTINDGGATYPPLAPGGTQACTVDCLAVTVDAAVRPQLHWDATGVEALDLPAQGQQKAWALHVGGSFDDVSTVNPFYRFVETLLHRGISSGCGGGSYCPGSGTTRDQMAVFVLLAKEGSAFTPPACSTPPFNDVPTSSPFCPFVAELARRGVVGGCTGGNYCPADPVTRAQMAVFALRTLEPTLAPAPCASGNERFNDLPAASIFCPWVEELARRGVVTGCSANSYCPGDPVLRDQMGVFISLTFGLTLYGP